MSEIYKVGVAMMLTGNIAASLSHVSTQLFGIHRSVGQIQAGFSSWRSPLVAVGSILGGTMILGAMAKIAEHGDKFLDQQAKLRNLGLTNQQIAEATARAWSNTRAVPGSKVDENLKSIGELNSIMGFGEALKLSPKFAQLDQVLKQTTGKSGSAFTTAKAGELLGVFTDKQTGELDYTGFTKFMDMIARSAIASHGKVTPNDWLNFAKQAGPAAANLSDEGMLTETAIMQAMGGHRAGTAAAALNRQFAGGIMAQRVAKELMRIGIANEGDFSIGKGGQVIAKADAMKDLVSSLQIDPLAAIAGIILPKLQAAGFDTNEKLSAEIYRMIGTGPAQREVYELIRGRNQISAERDRAKQTLGVEAAGANLNANSPIAVRSAFNAGYENMMTAIGAPLMQAALPIMTAVTNMFNRLGEFATAHPDAIQRIGVGIAIMASGAVAAGIASLLAMLGPAGWLVLGIAALGVVLVNIDWTERFSSLTKSIQTINTALNLLTPGGLVTEGAKALLNRLHGSTPDASPPAATGGMQKQSWNLSVDGHIIAAVTTKYQVASMGGPSQGSGYFDATNGHTPVDFAFGRG